jgi:putative heme-binding domain-containing protein
VTTQSRLRAPSAWLLLICSLVLAAALHSTYAHAQTHAGQYEPADIEYGARLYSGACVTCHGERGDSMPGVNLGSGRFRRASSDRELTAVVRDGVPGTAMVPNKYTESELGALVAYLRNMGSVDLGRLVAGDPARGKELFEAKGNCGSCHRVGGRGPRVAPDLSNVGAIRTAAALQRSLLDPREALLPINRPVRAVLRNGTVVSGRRLNEDTHTVQLVDERERLVSLRKSDLRELAVSSEARMPSYEALLNEEERVDVVAYLLTLKGTN